MKAIKVFFKDLWTLQKQSNQFLKKHWLGYLIMGISIGLIEVGWFYREEIKDNVEEKFRKEDSNK